MGSFEDRVFRLEREVYSQEQKFHIVEVNEGETVIIHVGDRVLTVEEFEREFPGTTLIIIERVKAWKTENVSTGWNKP